MNLAALPKAELHCHMDGIIDPDILQKIQRLGYDCPLDLAMLQAAYPVRTFDEFVHWFSIAGLVGGAARNFLPILAQHIERLKTQNVTYAEIMLGSSELPHDDGHLIDEFSAFREVVDILEDGQVQIEFLVAVARTAPAERFDLLADRIIRLRRAGLLFGLALAGWPETSIQHQQRTLARLRDAGVGIEIHAGEWAGPELVWDALEYGPPDRLGHGVALFQDPDLVERFQQEQIHIEMCLTSNLKTGSVKQIEDHPIHLARQLGLNFSVNTDDPGPFENSMLGEYKLLAEAFGFQPVDFERLYANTLASRFQPKLRYGTIV